MQSSLIVEPVKIRLRGYRTLFRRTLPLENYEEGILGLIHENNGHYDYYELGSLLGFAMQNDASKGKRKDVAEIELFNHYLENLKTNHLVQYNTQGIHLTTWGEKAMNDKVRYMFFSGYIQIPEFFDIQLSTESSFFTFKDIGVEVRLSKEKPQNKAWDIQDLVVPDKQIVDQFYRNRFNPNDIIIFDSIEPTTDIELIETTLEIRQDNSIISILYEGKLHEKLSAEINNALNIIKSDNLRLKLRYAALLEANELFTVEELHEFKTLVDWNEILENNNLTWSQRSIEFLHEYEVNWNIISSKSPVEVIIKSIDRHQEYFDWSELTNRLPLSFIFSYIENYPWDVDVLTNRISLDDFKANITSIIRLEGIDLKKFYKEIDTNFITQNFFELPGIEDYLVISKIEHLSDFLITYPKANWNKSLVSQNLRLEEIEGKYNYLKGVLNPEIVIERILISEYNFDDIVFQNVVNETSFSNEDKLINKNTKCNLSLDKLLALDNKKLIYWGNDNAPGFEQNKSQIWSINIIKTFTDRWNYNEAIKTLGSIIPDYLILTKINYDWDFKTVSENKTIINQAGFFEEFKDEIDVGSSLLFFEKDTLRSNLKTLILKNQAIEIEALFDVISSLFSLVDIFETFDTYSNFYVENSDKLNWKQIWTKTSKQFVKEKVEELFLISETVTDLKYLVAEITNCFEIEEILNLSDLNWDWNIVTERAIDKELINDDNLIAFSDLWDWKVLIEKYFEPEDIRIEGRLSEIAALISQSSKEISEKSWRLITEVYPAHLIWNAINATNNIELFKWDWTYISSSNKISLDLNTIKRYKKDLNWSVLSSNSFLNGFFRNDKEIYQSRRQWENHVLPYLSEFTDLWDFKELSKLDNITRSENIVNLFRSKWDWDILSSDRSKLLTIKGKQSVAFNERVIEKFDKFLNFEIISSRTDATIDTDLLKKFDHKNWDWGILSNNQNLKIEKETLLNDLIDKPWNWNILCKNPIIKFTNDDLILLQNKDLDWQYLSFKEYISNSTIVQLSEKEWDWYVISSSQFLIFDENLLQILNKKANVNWHNVLRSNNLHCNNKTLRIIAQSIKSEAELWSVLSGNKNLLFNENNLLEEFKEYWDWDTLIELERIDINTPEILKEYQNYINWNSLSSASYFAPDISILQEFKHLLNWRYLTPRIPLKEEFLDSFQSYIDWGELCKTSNFDGQLPLLEKFINFIDFGSIENNPTVDYETKLHIENYLNENIHKRFVYDLKKQRSTWSGYAYHFTHLTNAVEIIRNRKIVSRNRALKTTRFSDAAGSVVNRRHDAHEYARFYFRPQTPTQFYNECLGKDYLSDKYSQALNLGLPKCPIPVFFKFSIDEIFKTQFDKCFISNGNLQTNWARIGTVGQMYNLFDFEDVYSTIGTTSDGNWRTYLNKSQQEFLVKDQFDFSNIHNYVILVRNESDLSQLRHHLKEFPEVIPKIKVAEYRDNIYLNDNKSIDYRIEGNNVSITTNYNGNGTRAGYFEIELKNDLYKINSGNVLSKTGNKIRFFPAINIEFESEPCVKVTFKDQVTDKEPWQIINYCLQTHGILKETESYVVNEVTYPQSIEDICIKFPVFHDVFNTTVRHYTLRDHTNLVLNQFDKYFSHKFKTSEKELFRFFLIVHDIGKPQAFIEGNKDNQYVYSIQLVKGIWGSISKSQEDLKKISFMLEGDYLGEYFQSKKDIDNISQIIVQAARSLNTSPIDLLKILIIYYQCDTAAYTQDAGGLKFLEYLFHYEKGNKVFDEKEGMLKFSSNYWNMYLKLKHEILKWQ